jgi:hypothetical protein
MIIAPKSAALLYENSTDENSALVYLSKFIHNTKDDFNSDPYLFFSVPALPSSLYPCRSCSNMEILPPSMDFHKK